MENIIDNNVSKTNFERALEHFGIKSQKINEESYVPFQAKGDYKFIKDPKKLGREIEKVLKGRYQELRHLDLEVSDEGLTVHGYFDSGYMQKGKVFYNSMLGVLHYLVHLPEYNN